MRINRWIDARVPRVEEPPARSSPAQARPRPRVLECDPKWSHLRARPTELGKAKS